MARRIFSLLLVLACVGCGSDTDSPWNLPDEEPEHSQATPVSVNLAADVPDGFRGDVHPLLSDSGELSVAAHWSPIGRGRAYDMGYFPYQFYGPFVGVKVAEPRRNYGAADFSAFMPAQFSGVGQMWAIDLDKAVGLLKQFHGGASGQLMAPGRRAGPNGGVAILRAESDTHADLVFRIHAEFQLDPHAWFTPAYFTGRMIVNKRTGSVEYFRLALPTDHSLNATLTVLRPEEALLDIVFVDRMDLVGGDDKLLQAIEWTDEIDDDVAAGKLKGAFYKFMDIQWVPFEQAVSVAKEHQKPILAVVLWGGLDEQDC